MSRAQQTVSSDDLMKEVLQSLLSDTSSVEVELSAKRDAEVEEALAIVAANHEDEGFTGPTPERARIANGALSSFPLEDRNSRAILATGFEVCTPVKKMALMGQITQAQADAAERFHKSFAIATQQSRTTGRYGIEMAMAAAVGRAGGTPIGQMTAEAAKRMTHQEMRANHANYYRNACAALGDARAAIWLTALLNEDTMPGADKPITLADVGRNFMGYESEKSCQTAGSTLVRWWLKILCNHYGFTD